MTTPKEIDSLVEFLDEELHSCDKYFENVYQPEKEPGMYEYMEKRQAHLTSIKRLLIEYQKLLEEKTIEKNHV